MLLTLRRVRFLAGTYRNLIDRIPLIYARFKRLALRQNKWFLTDSQTPGGRNRVSGVEVDVMLLLMLRHARRFLSMGGAAQLRYDTRIATLESIKQEYATQVLVDEATDFSLVQLSCMLELAHPTFRSFFACGDVYQRVTRWGVQNLSELKEISPDFEVKEIDIAYRQSRKLMELGIAIAKLGGGQPPRIQIPDNYEQAEVMPILGEGLGKDSLARWLLERICEIERALKIVPSIAIFVDTDERIDGLLSKLKPLLAEYNLDVVGCPGGRVVGGESQIRIFDVQHIKGLEFEAVFFVGVDILLARHGELFTKLLFVGVTRAATYLGITCENTLPKELEPLRNHFMVSGWS
jgi:DNA helicase IV